MPKNLTVAKWPSDKVAGWLRALLFVTFSFFGHLATLPLGHSSAFAQSSNSTYSLIQETITATGGSMAGASTAKAEGYAGLLASGLSTNTNYKLSSDHLPYLFNISGSVTITGTVNDPQATVRVNEVTALVGAGTFTASGVKLILGPNTLAVSATDPVGNTSTTTLHVYLDLPASRKILRFNYRVQGAINEAATVSVNSVSAAFNAGTFTADVPLFSGMNTITTTATDSAGNSTSRSMRVYVPVPEQIPPMPTVGTGSYTLPDVTTQSSITIGGTKTKGTSIWINGLQVYAVDDQTTWQATISLVEGDNWLAITAKDANGVTSASTNVNVVVDNLAPRVTVASTMKTNFNPFLFTGTVDDSLTSVTVNGVAATNNRGTFQASIPLGTGATAVSITALSPRNLSATASSTVTLGKIPTIQSTNLADKTKLYAGTAMTLQIQATDADSDPIKYRLLINGTPPQDWITSNSQTWTPSIGQLGFQKVTAEVKDDFGGSNTKDADTFVVRPPIQHP